MEWLPIIWALALGFGVAMYVILDGFDLGVGILFPFFSTSKDRDLAMQSIAPFWDGNETWLVLGGAGLLAGFPLAYSILLPALYIPLMIFLTALIFRGVAFEFRAHAHSSRFFWSCSFFCGSFVMAFSQGLVLGAFIQGFTLQGETFVGGPFDWLTPFTLLVGISLVCGYMLLGAAWLILKTEGALQERCFKLCYPLLALTVGLLGVVSLWTPFLQQDIALIWFSWPNIIFLSPLPFCIIGLVFFFWKALTQRNESLPFLCAICLFCLSYLGLGISLWPYIVPRALTIWEAAAAPNSQLFGLIGLLALLPVVLWYTYSSYKVFKGKVKIDHEGY